MIAIKTHGHLDDLFAETAAVLFFEADWSQYALISRQMMSHVESYARMGKVPIAFYSGAFDGEDASMANRLREGGIQIHAFNGGGSVAFYRKGELTHFMLSVISEGTDAVWREIDRIK
ncbi:MAG: hypothetical protein AAF586_00025 [Planctomycetota bacterium]